MAKKSMKKSPILLLLILFFLAPAYAQSSRTLDDVLADIVATAFPKFRLERPGAPFRGSYPTTPVKIMLGDWKKGKSQGLSIVAFITETPAEVEKQRNHFLTRAIMPRSAPVRGLGEDAILLSTCTFVNIAFSKENVFVTLNYSFRRGCDTSAPAKWNVAAPSKEIERVTKLAQALYTSITTKRSMTPCHNDFLNTYFPRPTNDGERMLEAAFNGNSLAIKSLVAVGVPVAGVDSEGNTPLHLAVRHGCTDAIQALIEAKADMNARNLKGQTPLMISANLKDLEASRLLINAGTDLAAQDKHGSNAATHSITPRYIYTLFPQPEVNGLEIRKLLEARGVKPSR